jgi:hypothetical protein
MSKRASTASVVGLMGVTAVYASFTLALGCGDKAAEEQAKAPLAPALGPLELPVSLRNGDAAPTDARKVEANINELRVDDQVVLPLANGLVAAAERDASGVLPKLKAALSTPSRTKLALGVHASLPYETAALILNTAAAAGMRQLVLQVRKPGASTATGWLAVDAFQTTPRTDDDVAFPSVEGHKWDEFTAAWQAVYDACRGSQTGSCAYVPGSFSKGGNVKIVLFAAGQGVNVNFFRTGLTQEQLDAEAKARDAELAKKKEDVVQGRGGTKKTDLEAELADGAPPNEASFQFRAKDALDAPSAVTDVMQPLCGKKACGVVVSGESNTLMVRVVSLIGAAFDGGAPPVLAFELPWTEKPKPVAAAAAPAEAAK